MGANWSQQGCLRLNKEQGLVERDKLKKGSEYAFEKSKHRLYMLEIPMMLITDDWKAIATIMITEITVGHRKTKGIYKVLKVYSDDEVKVVSGTLVPYYQVQGK